MSERPHGIRLVVAYDGTAFHGWARQPGQRTVQGVLEACVGEMAGHPVICRGAGRTDRGVHALGQVAAFDAARDIPARGWLRGVNQLLPGDLSVRASEAVPPGYDPRFDALDKTYRYLLSIDDEHDPLLRDRVWRLPPVLRHPDRDRERERAHPSHALDLDAMRACAAGLVGTHDFRAFRAADDDREQTIRTLHRVELTLDWAGDPRQIAITVTGTAFMKNMVRILVGSLVDVGRGRKTPSDVLGLLGPRGNREGAGRTAPPQGLTLVEVRLGRERGSDPEPA